jgi:hypothetical protein
MYIALWHDTAFEVLLLAYGLPDASTAATRIDGRIR